MVHKQELAHCTKDNFLIHTPNPLKIMIKTITIIKRLEKQFSHVRQESNSVIETLTKLTVDYIQTIKNSQTLKTFFSEPTYDGCDTLDLIASYDLTKILENEVIDTLVTQYWNGPYECMYFMNNSLKYRTLKAFFT